MAICINWITSAVFLLSSQWQSLGPEGGNITSMAMYSNNPSLIYASTYTAPCRIYRTTDGGENWDFVSTVDDLVNCLGISAYTSNLLYASTWGEYVYKSTDAGLNWTGYRTNSDNNCIYDLRLDSTNPNVIWGAADCYDGYYFVMAAAKSINGGSTWSFLPLTTSNWGAGYSVAIDPINPNTVYVGGYSYDEDYILRPRIFKTTSGGLDWDNIGSGIDSLGIMGYVYALAIDPSNSNRLYAGGYYWDEHWNYSYLLKSIDGGLSWMLMSSGITSPIHYLTIDPSSPNTIYAGGEEEVFKTENAARSWSSSDEGIVGQHIRSLLLNPASPSILYAGNRTGIFKTTDGGSNWSSASSGIVATRISGLRIASSSPNILYIGIENDALYKSTNDGADWARLQEFSGCRGVEALAVDPQDANKIYLFTGG